MKPNIFITVLKVVASATVALILFAPVYYFLSWFVDRAIELGDTQFIWIGWALALIGTIGYLMAKSEKK